VLKPTDARVSFNEDIIITSIDGKKLEVKKGDPIILGNKPIEVSAKGKKSMIIFPVNGQNSVMSFQLPLLSNEDINSELKKTHGKKIDLIISTILTAQKNLAEKKPELAISDISKLQTEFPELALLDFVMANLNIIAGDREAAKLNLEKGLLKMPENVDAVKLYKSLLRPGENDVTRQPSGEVKP
jgi:hypothetical protein